MAETPGNATSAANPATCHVTAPTLARTRMLATAAENVITLLVTAQRARAAPVVPVVVVVATQTCGAITATAWATLLRTARHKRPG